MTNPGDRISVNLRHAEAMKFQVDVNGRSLELNSDKEMGRAFTPMELFLTALAGCTAMDVQWILGRQRQKVDKFEMEVSGVRREEDPRYYESIDMKYTFVGAELRKDAVERAIRLSQEKYCSVHAMMKDSVKLTITYSISSGSEPETVYPYPAN